MKTQQLIILAMFLCTALISYSQRTFLKITQSENAIDVIVYPPGTKFELKTKEGYIVFKNSDDPGTLDIDDEYTLYVYPSWKDAVDVFKLTEGKVEKVLTSTYTDDENNSQSTENNDVTAHFTVSDSKEREGKKNLNFKLSNGITFIYEDDKYRAYLNEEDNYIRIKGTYVIETELGTLKLSFNPSNGVVWWVFDKKQNNLIGNWKIDLRPTPSSPEYFQILVISKVEGKTIEGTFYGSPIKDGFINTNWERTYFLFTTSDGSYDYYHSGYMLNGKLYGISYCPNRSLTAPWIGKLK
ncbi:hypothetical protein [Winogradskyella sp. MIT101101]|uniref:hypothetical protein n=1 Tax=Winogradskyella sp. MIT101101 TaxID=3098297 RepID=UPI00399A753D